MQIRLDNNQIINTTSLHEKKAKNTNKFKLKKLKLKRPKLKLKLKLNKPKRTSSLEEFLSVSSSSSSALTFSNSFVSKSSSTTESISNHTLTSLSTHSLPLPKSASSSSSSLKLKQIETSLSEEDFWNDDNYIDENFNLNFDKNQSPHLYLIGTCSSRSNNNLDSSSINLDNSDELKAEPEVAESISNNRYEFLKRINILNRNRRSSSNKKLKNSMKMTSSDNKANCDLGYDNKSFYFNQVNQINVDGFEWDLV